MNEAVLIQTNTIYVPRVAKRSFQNEVQKMLSQEERANTGKLNAIYIKI